MRGQDLFGVVVRFRLSSPGTPGLAALWGLEILSENSLLVLLCLKPPEGSRGL